MVHVQRIDVYYVRKTAEGEQPAESVQIRPASQEPDDMKLDLARTVKQIKDTVPDAYYYYAVFKVRMSNKKIGYRTVVPKHFFRES